MVSVVASRYARALVDILFSPGAALTPADATGQLREVEAMLAGSHDLHILLLSPAVAPSKKRAVVGRLATPLGLATVVRNFLFVLIDHRRVGILSQIREAVEDIVDERMGLVRADVASAGELTAAQQVMLESELSRRTGKRVRLEFRVDPSLVGGVVARIGSTVYDGSVRGALNTLRKNLAS